MTTTVLSKAQGGRWPTRHGEAVEGLGDAGPWPSRECQQLTGSVTACPGP